MRLTTVRYLIDHYNVVLLDAYGVLVDASSAITGAPELIAELNSKNKQYFVVTNDASRLPETCAARFRGLGLPIPADRILTSGMVLEEYFVEHHLQDAGCVVLGPEDSLEYVRIAGGEIIALPAEDHRAVQAVIIGDESGFATLEGLDAVLTLIFRKLDRDEPIALLLPNPDLVYPKSGDRYGLAAGALAAMIEQALTARGHRAEFERLGKPYRPLFDEALRRAACPSDQVVMIGDQLETDIRGANAVGIAGALVTSGVAKLPEGELPAEIRPRYLLTGLV
jgi:HAD superfamily hydrolase (TIGR01450 family)